MVKKARGRPRDFDLNEALDKAVEVFWELGYEAADTETLATRMGLSKPSVYNTFGSKEDLFLRAIRRYGETISKQHVDILLNSGSPSEGLHTFFLAIAQDVSGQQHPSGCLIACVAIPVAERMPAAATAMREAWGSGQGQMAAYFEAEMAKGMLPATFNISAAVSLIQDLMIAMALRGRMGSTRAELEKDAARNAELVMLSGATNGGE